SKPWSPCSPRCIEPVLSLRRGQPANRSTRIRNSGPAASRRTAVVSRSLLGPLHAGEVLVIVDGWARLPHRTLWPGRARGRWRRGRFLLEAEVEVAAGIGRLTGDRSDGALRCGRALLGNWPRRRRDRTEPGRRRGHVVVQFLTAEGEL